MEFNETIKQHLRGLIPIYHSLSDDRILHEITEGNDREGSLIYLLYGRYADMLKTITRTYASGKVDFDDFLADLELKLIRNDYAALKQFNGKSQLKTWLSSIARNLLFDMMKRENTDRFVSLEGVELSDNTYENEQMSRAMECIRRYGSGDAQFIIFKEMEGYSPSEIAQLLTVRRRQAGTLGTDEEVTVNNIYMLKSRLISKIRRQMMPAVAEERHQVEMDRAVSNFMFCLASTEDSKPSPMAISSPEYPSHRSLISRIRDVLQEVIDN